MVLSPSILKSRPYRYYLLLHDFITRTKFSLAHSGETVAFDYMGNSTKYYTPDQFSTYHDVVDAISWMKSSDIYFKHGTMVYSLINITMPDYYEHGARSEFYHIFTGLAVIYKFRNPDKLASQKDVLQEFRSLGERTLEISRDRLIELDVNVEPSTLAILQDMRFRPLFKDELYYATNFVNGKIVSENIRRLASQDKYDIRLVIGQNRGITTSDIKLFESIRRNPKEIKLDHRTNPRESSR